MRNLCNKVICVSLGLAALFTVQPATASEVVNAIREASLEHGVDTKLMLAMAQVESNYNTKAQGSRGEVGLFQLRPEFFGDAASTDARVNSKAAARYLILLKKKCAAYGKAWFVCFNTGPNRKAKLKQPLQFVYYKRVMAARHKLDTISNIAASHD